MTSRRPSVTPGGNTVGPARLSAGPPPARRTAGGGGVAAARERNDGPGRFLVHPLGVVIEPVGCRVVRLVPGVVGGGGSRPRRPRVSVSRTRRRGTGLNTSWMALRYGNSRPVRSGGSSSLSAWARLGGCSSSACSERPSRAEVPRAAGRRGRAELGYLGEYAGEPPSPAHITEPGLRDARRRATPGCPLSRRSMRKGLGLRNDQPLSTLCWAAGERVQGGSAPGKDTVPVPRTCSRRGEAVPRRGVAEGWISRTRSSARRTSRPGWPSGTDRRPWSGRVRAGRGPRSA